MTPLPKIVVDTNVFINVANCTISEDVWRRTRAHIRRAFRYRLSDATFDELLFKLGNGSDNCFGQNRLPLELLNMGQDLRPSEVLEYPVDFAIKHSLDIPPPKRAVREFRRERLAALDSLKTAKSRKQLNFDLDSHCRGVQGRRAENARRLTYLRDEPGNATSKCHHAKLILIDVGIKRPTKSQVAKFCQDIDAMLTMSSSFQGMMNNPNFDPANHASHLDDAYQLLYLSDPSMRILTMDRKEFVVRTTGSPQQDRIVLWKDFFIHV